MPMPQSHAWDVCFAMLVETQRVFVCPTLEEDLFCRMPTMSLQRWKRERPATWKPPCPVLPTTEESFWIIYVMLDVLFLFFSFLLCPWSACPWMRTDLKEREFYRWKHEEYARASPPEWSNYLPRHLSLFVLFRTELWEKSSACMRDDDMPLYVWEKSFHKKSSGWIKEATNMQEREPKQWVLGRGEKRVMRTQKARCPRDIYIWDAKKPRFWKHCPNKF